MSDREVQVAPEHYDFERYDDAERWMSYWHQLRAVLSVRPKTVLEIGPGSGVFRNYLRAAGVDGQDARHRSRRATSISSPTSRSSMPCCPRGVTFDAICAFQVLEHLPFWRTRNLPAEHRAAREPARVRVAAVSRAARAIRVLVGRPPLHGRSQVHAAVATQADPRASLGDGLSVHRAQDHQSDRAPPRRS